MQYVVVGEPEDAIIIGDMEVPLDVIVHSTHASWALINLMLSIFGVILASYITISTILTERRKKDDEKFAEAKKDEKDNSIKHNRALWLIIPIATAIAAAILFILTQNIRLSMVWLDRWTVVHIILFSVGLIATLLMWTRKDKEKDDKTTTRESGEI